MNAISPEMLSRLDALSQKLGVTGQALWDALIKQSRIEVAQDVLLILIALIVLAFVGWGVYALSQKLSSDKYKDWDDYFLPYAFLACMGLLAFISILVNATAAWTAYANPVFWAFDHVLHSLK